ncbi:hypothetical protein D3C84_1263620 [compost metagenome]
MHSPQKVMRLFLQRRFLKAGDHEPLRINAGENVLDRAILSAGVHSLKNNQQGMLFLGKKDILEFG